MRIFRRRQRHRHHTGISPFKAGAISIAVVVVFCYFAYTQANPFANPYEFSAVFQSANNLKGDAVVRIAGVNVGKVTKVEPIGEDGAARVTMEVSDEGLPIHQDARLKIRPRIFLEGNFFVDVQPGSPTAPELEDGGEVPVQQTATPVQFADVLAALQSDTRADLQVLLEELSKGLEGKGAEGLNETYRFAEDAYKQSALANEASLGTREHDLSELVKGQQETFRALARHEQNLRDLVTNFNTFAAALAREDDALQATIPALDDVLRVGSPALRSLNDSLPSLRAFARDALPATVSSGPTIDSNLPFIRQARQLVGERELKGLVADLRVTIPDLVELDEGQTAFLEQGRALSACQNNVLLPFAQTPIPDPDFPDNTGQPFYKQSSRGLVGLSGESRISDAVSPMFHFNFGSGPYTLIQPGETGEKYVGTTAFPPIGVRPARPDRRPDARPDVPCETQEPPNLNAPGGGPSTTVAKTQYKPSAADRRLTKRSIESAQALLDIWAGQTKGRATKAQPLEFVPADLPSTKELRKAVEKDGAR
jgi:virulence factor Mce-like protein